VCAPLYDEEADQDSRERGHNVWQTNFTLESQNVEPGNLYEYEFPALSSYQPGKNDGSCHPLPSLPRRSRKEQFYRQRAEIENKLSQGEKKKVRNKNWKQKNISNSTKEIINGAPTKKVTHQFSTGEGHDLLGANVDQNSEEIARITQLISRLTQTYNMVKEQSDNPESPGETPLDLFTEGIEETELLGNDSNNNNYLENNFGNDEGQELENLLDHEDMLLATEDDMEIDPQSPIRMQIEKLLEQTNAFLQKPVSAIAHKGDSNSANLDSVGTPGGTGYSRETTVSDSSAPLADPGTPGHPVSKGLLPTAPPQCDQPQTTQTMPERVLEPGELPATPSSHEDTQQALPTPSEEELPIYPAATVSFVGSSEPREVDTSHGDTRESRSRHTKPRQTWVTPETMLMVKRTIQPRQGEFCCTICNWRGAYRRVRVHVKQHFVRYACPCGLTRVSRDSVFDHQNSKHRGAEAGHGQIPGEIFEVDEPTFPEFSARHDWAGPTTFPQMPPTTTGATQHTKKNSQSKSTRSNPAKGKAGTRSTKKATPSTSTPVLRVAAVRLTSPVQVPPPTEQRPSTSRPTQHSPSRLFMAERDRRAADLIAEATRLENLALETYRRSRSHPTQSDDYHRLRQQARSMEMEAQHYRQSAAHVRGHEL
jgi:hypothetical protein